MDNSWCPIYIVLVSTSDGPYLLFFIMLHWPTPQPPSPSHSISTQYHCLLLHHHALLVRVVVKLTSALSPLPLFVVPPVGQMPSPPTAALPLPQSYLIVASWLNPSLLRQQHCHHQHTDSKTNVTKFHKSGWQKRNLILHSFVVGPAIDSC